MDVSSVRNNTIKNQAFGDRLLIRISALFWPQIGVKLFLEVYSYCSAATEFSLEIFSKGLKNSLFATLAIKIVMLYFLKNHYFSILWEATKDHLISEQIPFSEIATKILLGFLPWKFLYTRAEILGIFSLQFWKINVFTNLFWD